MLMADIRYDFVRTYITLLNDVDLKDFNGTIDSLKAEGVKLLKGLQVRDELIRLEGSIEMRYYGQHHEITLPFVAENFDQTKIDDLAKRFHEMHETLFGYSEPEKRIEIMNIGIAAIGKMPKPEIKSQPLGEEDARGAIKEERSIYMGPEQGYCEVEVYEGEKLKPGNRFEGPAVVEDINTTMLLGPGQTLFVDGWKNYIVTLK
jgi:N-methylhydantoinase A